MINNFKSQINKHYNKLVLGFFIFAVLIIVFTSYFAFAKTVINLTPEPKKISESVTFETEKQQININKTTLSDTYTYSDLSQQGEATEDFASGTVTIYNNYSADQGLIATTRLLSESGVLFRTQTDVTVPKNGSIDVEVKADQKGVSGDIDATKFEIVALNDSKKSAIYGESKEKMVGGVIYSTVVTENDLATAKKQAENYLLTKAKAEFKDQIKKFDENNIKVNIIKNDADKQVGQTASELKIAITGEYIYSNLDVNKIDQICLDAFQQQINNGFQVILNKNIEYSYDEATKQIQIECSGNAKITENAKIIDKEKLTNKNQTEIEQYLLDFSQIKSVSVEFSPFWIKTSPFIKENIILKIVE